MASLVEADLLFQAIRDKPGKVSRLIYESQSQLIHSRRVQVQVWEFCVLHILFFDFTATPQGYLIQKRDLRPQVDSATPTSDEDHLLTYVSKNAPENI